MQSPPHLFYKTPTLSAPLHEISSFSSDDVSSSFFILFNANEYAMHEKKTCIGDDRFRLGLDS